MRHEPGTTFTLSILAAALTMHRFWEHKSLDEMTDSEWESLCDGCGKCCLHKLEDDDTGEIYYTDIPCELLDCETGRCQNYAKRTTLVPDCVNIRTLARDVFHWLPATCAYRLLAEGEPLPVWHPLISGDPNTVGQHINTVQGRVKALSLQPPPEDMEEHIVHWVDF